MEITAKRIIPVKNKYNIQPTRALYEGDHALEYTSTMMALLNRLGVRINYNNGGYTFGGVLFIDNFRVSDKDELWSIPPSDVKQMEYINPGNASALIYGSDVMLGGSLMVFLKDGGEILKKPRTPSEAMKKVNQIGYKPFVEFYSPRYQTPTEFSRPIPDFRTTLFWSPDIVVNDSGITTAEFYTTDDPGDFNIIIEGISDSGRIVRKGMERTHYNQ